MNVSFKEVIRGIAWHCKILLRGFIKTLYGSITAGLAVFTVYGFSVIPSEGGYAAVGDFIAAICTLILAVTCMYIFGCRRQKKCRGWAHG